MQQLTTQRSQAFVTFARLLRAHAALTRELNARLIAAHGLTLNDYEVLMRLARAEERSMRRVDLANEVFLSPSGITRMLDRLQEAGLVENASCREDARVKYAALTDDGMTKLREVSPGHLSDVERLLGEGLGDEELATLAELLERLPGDGEESCEPPEEGSSKAD